MLRSLLTLATRIMCVSMCTLCLNACETTDEAPAGAGVTTSEALVHHGCVEKAGAACREFQAENACLGASNCRFEYEQCLPDGRGCPDQLTQSGCEDMAFCYYKTWADKCLWRCDLADSERACGQAPNCVWHAESERCRANKVSQCDEAATGQATCDAVGHCDFSQHCVPADLCPHIGTRAECEQESACSWADRKCRYQCTVKHTTVQSCSADPACEWDNRGYVCVAKVEQACYSLSEAECSQNSKCGFHGHCTVTDDCASLDSAACGANAECTQGLCEHSCTPNSSRRKCEEDPGCAWISIPYQPGQRCTTACHLRQ